MFAISNSLSKSEAISFAKTINTEDKYYIVVSKEILKLGTLKSGKDT